MTACPSYAAPTEIGGVMEGGTVCQVEISQIPDFAVGDIVEGRTGWQEYVMSDGRGVRKIDPSLAPITTVLGVLGMPGMTAWTGLKNIGQPKPGETLVVAAASGAVGSLVGQLASSRAAVPSELLAVKRSATMSSKSLVSTPASITAAMISPRHSRPPARKASTSTSKTSAACLRCRPPIVQYVRARARLRTDRTLQRN